MKDDRFLLYSHWLDPHAGYIRNAETSRFKGSSQQNYDGEIAFADKWFGELIKYLKEVNLLDRTLVMVTADHGEEFRDHGNSWHGKFLYSESIQTPVIINFPHLMNRRVKIPVGSVDMIPTIRVSWWL